MTSAEKKMVLYLMYDGGPDCCRKCAYSESENCCLYDAKTDQCDSEKPLDDNQCIAGMIKFFEQQGAGNE